MCVCVWISCTPFADAQQFRICAREYFHPKWLDPLQLKLRRETDQLERDVYSHGSDFQDISFGAAIVLRVSAFLSRELSINQLWICWIIRKGCVRPSYDVRRVKFISFGEFVVINVWYFDLNNTIIYN